MEIIRLGDETAKELKTGSTDLAKLTFASHTLPDQGLSIWMMSSPGGKALFPWWSYSMQVDEDMQRLDNLWSVTSQQAFFDCLFLSQFKKFAGSNFFMIAPGYLRTDGWDKLSEPARAAYLRGQGCVYRLEGAYSNKLSINWVPFAQPQSLIKDPTFGSMWSMFVSSRTDDVATSVGCFALSDLHKLPQVVSLLIQPNDNRSLELASIVDWFSMYSSPITPEYGTAAVVYTKKPEVMSRLAEFQVKIQATVKETREALTASPVPHTGFRVLSRHVAI